MFRIIAVIAIFAVISVLFFSGPSAFAEEDALYERCKDAPRAPWCYEEEVVKQQQPDRCENITKHWGNAALGVQGYCFYEIAVKTRDCALCKRIKKSDIRKTCKLDACK